MLKEGKLTLFIIWLHHWAIFVQEICTPRLGLGQTSENVWAKLLSNRNYRRDEEEIETLLWCTKHLVLSQVSRELSLDKILPQIHSIQIQFVFRKFNGKYRKEHRIHQLQRGKISYWKSIRGLALYHKLSCKSSPGHQEQLCRLLASPLSRTGLMLSTWPLIFWIFRNEGHTFLLT